MGILSGILTALSLLKEIVDGGKALVQFVEDNKKEAWFQESAQVFQELKAAQTPEERKDAADKIRRLIGGI